MGAILSAVPSLPLTGGTLTGNLTVQGHYLSSQAPLGAAAGAGAGSSPPAPVVDAGSYDAGGRITWGTGLTPAAGAQVAVTFTEAYTSQIPGVAVAPLNAATEALGLYVTPSLTGFTVSTAVAPTASQPNTTYGFTYTVLGSNG